MRGRQTAKPPKDWVPTVMRFKTHVTWTSRHGKYFVSAQEHPYKDRDNGHGDTLALLEATQAWRMRSLGLQQMCAERCVISS
jgi:hypothetical protein